MNTKLMGLVFLVLLGGPMLAVADTVNFDFSATNGTDTISALFTLDFSGGQAISGTGSVNSNLLVPNPETLTLVTQSTAGVNILNPATNNGATLSYRFGGGTDLIGDTVVNSSNPYFSSNGLVFMAAGPNNNGFNIWSSGGTIYAGFLAGNPNTGSGILYTQFNGGTLTATPVPLPAALPLLLSSFAGLGALVRQRKLALG